MRSFSNFNQAQRAYLNNNRPQMEEEVDEAMNELWKLKRKIHNSYKDSHYDLGDLAWSVGKISRMCDELSEKWFAATGELYSETYPSSIRSTRNTQRKLEFTEDDEEENTMLSSKRFLGINL